MATNVAISFRRTFATTAIKNQLKDVVIVGAARTPMGSFRGYEIYNHLVNISLVKLYELFIDMKISQFFSQI